MNTTSLVLNGRTAASISLLPERKRATLTTFYPRPSTPTFAPPTPSLSGRSIRPVPKRSPPSRDSPGWYNTDGGMTLDDFAKRLDTALGRFEQWQGRCAQNVVMALMRPTPLVLFVFNPLSILLWIVLLVWWFNGRSE